MKKTWFTAKVRLILGAGFMDTLTRDLYHPWMLYVIGVGNVWDITGKKYTVERHLVIDRDTPGA